MKPLTECKLYTFVDTAYLRGRPPEAVARALCDGGSDLIQLRAKKLPVDDVRRMAAAILPVTRTAGVGLVINDHPQVAAELGADLCHLGQEDFFDAGHRAVGEFNTSKANFGIGLSTHSPEQAKRAVLAGPAYIAVGPVYATGTKPGARPVTLEYVKWAAANVTLPWFAIGGINLSNLEDVLSAGARRICVVSAILNEKDTAVACREFRKMLEA